MCAALTFLPPIFTHIFLYEMNVRKIEMVRIQVTLLLLPVVIFGGDTVAGFAVTKIKIFCFEGLASLSEQLSCMTVS